MKESGNIESGGNLKESQGKQFEVVIMGMWWEERSTTQGGGGREWKYRGEGREESLGEDSFRNDIKENGVSVWEEVYDDRATLVYIVIHRPP